ncbi:hypothetical protein BJX96DRAFT_61625 [Aspergillus floccosus]
MRITAREQAVAACRRVYYHRILNLTRPGPKRGCGEATELSGLSWGRKGTKMSASHRRRVRSKVAVRWDLTSSGRSTE